MCDYDFEWDLNEVIMAWGFEVLCEASVALTSPKIEVDFESTSPMRFTLKRRLRLDKRHQR